eukprot:scaffold15937_cov141-Skeletonema_marinoi.AAC.8
MWIDDIMNDEQVILNSLRWTTYNSISKQLSTALLFFHGFVLRDEVQVTRGGNSKCPLVLLGIFCPSKVLTFLLPTPSHVVIYS